MTNLSEKLIDKSLINSNINKRIDSFKLNMS